MADLIDPTEFCIKDQKFILSCFPAVEGRKILVLYPLSGLPQIGDYAINEETMLKLMSYVAVEKGGVQIRLSTPDLVNNHCRDAETLMSVEMAMMEKNYSFFRDGRISDFFGNLTQMLLRKASEMLTHLSAPSSPTEKPLSTN